MFSEAIFVQYYLGKNFMFPIWKSILKKMSTKKIKNQNSNNTAVS